MKKIQKLLLGLVLIFTVTGCEMGNMDNTPTKKVEAFLDKYQKLDSNVLNDLDLTLADDTTIDEASRSEYRDFMKKHYQDLEYKIKDEKVDGDEATVTAEVKVRDYSKVISDADTYKETNANEFNDENNTYNPGLFSKYRLDKMKEVTEKVTYTIDFHLTKKEDEWILDELSEEDEQKINGLYNDPSSVNDEINNTNDETDNADNTANDETVNDQDKSNKDETNANDVTE